MKWICSRCGTVNKKNFCKKCHGSKRRFYSEYVKPQKQKANVESDGIAEPIKEKRYRLISEAILILHYLFLLIPVISIKGVNSTQTYSALGMLYDLSLGVYIFALLAISSACVYFMEILPKMQKSIVIASMVVNVLSFSIIPLLIIVGKFKGFSLTFGGVLYILMTIFGEIVMVKYYNSVFSGEQIDDEDEEIEDDVKEFKPQETKQEKVTDFYVDDGYRPTVNIPIKNETVICPMCGEKVLRGTEYCPKCNTLILRKAPSRDINSDSRNKF